MPFNNNSNTTTRASSSSIVDINKNRNHNKLYNNKTKQHINSNYKYFVKHNHILFLANIDIY